MRERRVACVLGERFENFNLLGDLKNDLSIYQYSLQLFPLSFAIPRERETEHFFLFPNKKSKKIILQKVPLKKKRNRVTMAAKQIKWTSSNTCCSIPRSFWCEMVIAIHTFFLYFKGPKITKTLIAIWCRGVTSLAGQTLDKFSHITGIHRF